MDKDAKIESLQKEINGLTQQYLPYFQSFHEKRACLSCLHTTSDNFSVVWRLIQAHRKYCFFGPMVITHFSVFCYRCRATVKVLPPPSYIA